MRSNVQTFASSRDRAKSRVASPPPTRAMPAFAPSLALSARGARTSGALCARRGLSAVRAAAGPADVSGGDDGVRTPGVPPERGVEDEGEAAVIAGGKAARMGRAAGPVAGGKAVSPGEFEVEEDDEEDAVQGLEAGVADGADDLENIAGGASDNVGEIAEGSRTEMRKGVDAPPAVSAATAGVAKGPAVEKPAKKLETDAMAEKKDVSAEKETTGSATGKDVASTVSEPGAAKGTAVKMTPEKLEKAKAVRAAAAKKAAEKSEQDVKSRRELFEKAEKLVVGVGEGTKAFEIGKKARDRVEAFVDESIKLGEAKDATQQDKLKSSAAAAARSLSSALGKRWEDDVAPVVQEKLPEEYRGFTKTALASSVVGFFVAIALLPVLFGGGGNNRATQTAAQKKIDTDTASLEKRLNRDRAPPGSSSKSTVTSSSSASRGKPASVFPPEEKGLAPLPSSASKTTSSGQPSSLSAAKSVSSSEKTPTAKDGATSGTQPNAVAEAPSAKVEPVKNPEPLKPSQVTPAMVMSSVTKSFGEKAAFVTAASFDSLSPEPTIVLEVTKAFHRLPAMDQRTLADTALKSARSLGFENVALVEAGTGVQVAHAGVDILLEDETANLRAELAALRKQSDKMATTSANEEVEIDKLKQRMDEERDEFAATRAELENVLKGVRSENTGLIADINDAKAEIAQMPDRQALEERTEEAERRSEKMAETVEMLSRQVTVARDGESAAIAAQAEAKILVEQADRTKTEALASVDSRIEASKAEAERRAKEAITASQEEARVSIEAADGRASKAEKALVDMQKASDDKLASVTSTLERQVVEERGAAEKQLAQVTKSKDAEMQTIQSKYEAMLNDVQRKAKADLDAFQKEADSRMAAARKEAKSSMEALVKERDATQKELESTIARSKKEGLNAARERDTLKAKIEKLQAKSKGGNDGGVQSLPVSSESSPAGAPQATGS